MASPHLCGCAVLSLLWLWLHPRGVMAVVTSRALAEHLGPPSRYEYRNKTLDPDEALRQIELAEAKLKFGSNDAVEALARWNYQRVLNLLPHELVLHHKVWQMLIATRRAAEADQSYRTTCQRVACDPSSAAYHACVRTSATLHPPVPLRLSSSESQQPATAASMRDNVTNSSAGPSLRLQRRAHIIELPQPRRPLHIDAEERARSRAFLAFNPAIAPLYSAHDEAVAGSTSPDDHATLGSPHLVSPRARPDGQTPPDDFVSPPPPPPPPPSPVAPGASRFVVFFRYSNIRSIWATTTAGAWQRARDADLWAAALSPGMDADQNSSSVAAQRDLPPSAALANGNTLIQTALSSGGEGEAMETEDAARALDAIIEQAESVAQGKSSSERWRELRDLVERQTNESSPTLSADSKSGAARVPSSAAGVQAAAPTTFETAGAKTPPGRESSTVVGTDAVPAAHESVTVESSSAELDDDDMQVFDVVTVGEGDGEEVLIPAGEPSHNLAAMGSEPRADLHGGYSAVGYYVVERSSAGSLRVVSDAQWLQLDAPFAPCAQCSDGTNLGWALSPAACKMAAQNPIATASVLVGLMGGGILQLIAALKRTLSRRRLARLPLLRGVLLLAAALPARVCQAYTGTNGCTHAPQANATASKASSGSRSTTNSSAHKRQHRMPRGDTQMDGDAIGLLMNESANGSTAIGRASIIPASYELGLKARAADASSGSGGRRLHIEYDGYEDARVIARPGGELFLLANHEDCEGRRRLCLVRLRGDAQAGTLQQDATWVLRVDDEGEGGLALNDNEKNWSPFVHGGALYLTYSLQPHVVLRCAWSGGACRVVHESSADFLSVYDTLGQGLRGGTPYVRLPDGNLLAAMHVKDTQHTPALYSTVFYLLHGAPPFRVASLSPKFCLSEKHLEHASSARCALQYVTGIAIDPSHNLVLLSYGDFDRRAMLASLPLDAVVTLAKTHAVGPDGEMETECTSSTEAWEER